MWAELASAFLARFGHPDLASFQQLVGLEPTGQADDRTVRAMMEPRCGCPDGMLATEEGRWRRRELDLYVESYLPAMSRQDQDDLIDMARNDWMVAADLELRRTVSRSDADIIIGVGRGRADNFDGPWGVLAWAQLPPGDDRPLLLKFDADERWLKEATDRGILYRNVLEHELGHSFGLDHSRLRTALMFAQYSALIAKPQAQDDIPRIQALYGPPRQPPEPPPMPAGGTITITLAGAVAGLSVPGWRCSKLAGG